MELLEPNFGEPKKIPPHKNIIDYIDVNFGRKKSDYVFVNGHIYHKNSIYLLNANHETKSDER